jgi:SpoVK/Ycf46/Vps4 family AAA+-type ATPase
LNAFARRITPRYNWQDLVLPPDRIQKLRDVRNALAGRELVYDSWGFDRKLSSGKGISILFSGPAGTGKTMAAEVLAGSLGLDLLIIDLALVVSKYVGETEKNLSRIFDEATRTPAILFFDEADALFGRRTEVGDAHDRYANIEVAYLLQRIEQREGGVILASSLRRTIDEAFVRRMQFAVEFPLPNASDRLILWQRIWPSEAPLSAEIDWKDIAERFDIAGGGIRDSALGAAFAAASNGGRITRSHLMYAIRREYEHAGRVINYADFDSCGSSS